MDEPETPEAALFPERVGDRLRAARTKSGLDLSDIATRTRIPQRHLAAIEAGDYAALPALTYCVGFAKAYARAVGEDDVEVGRLVRGELGYAPDGRVDHADYDAADPARVPPKTLALTALAVAALVAGAYGLWRGGMFDGMGSTSGSAVADTSTKPVDGVPVAAKPAVPTTGQVVVTALDQVWLQVDSDGEKAMISREMKAGETYVVPATAVNPRLKTSRPDKLKITVGGVQVPPVGPPETLVKNVSLMPAALSGRPAEAAAGPAGATGNGAAASSEPALDANGAPIPRGLAPPPAPGLSDQN